jgi:hypothetical protein
VKGSGIWHWLSSQEEGLRSGWRIAVSSAANLGLALYFFSRAESFWDIRDFRYVPVNLTLVFVIVTIPTVVLVALVPVIAKARPMHRWIAIGLCILPGYLALAGWLQLCLVALG